MPSFRFAPTLSSFNLGSYFDMLTISEAILCPIDTSSYVLSCLSHDFDRYKKDWCQFTKLLSCERADRVQTNYVEVPCRHRRNRYANVTGSVDLSLYWNVLAFLVCKCSVYIPRWEIFPRVDLDTSDPYIIERILVKLFKKFPENLLSIYFVPVIL